MAGKVYDRQQLIVDRDPLRQLAVEIGNMPGRDPIDMLEKMVEVFEEFGFDAIEQITGLDLRFLKTILDTVKGFIGVDEWTDGMNIPAIWLNIIRGVLRPGGVINLDWLGEIVAGAGDAPVTLPVNLPFNLPSEATAATWFFSNIKKFLADIDFTNPDFNVGTALNAFVSLALLPLNLLAKLIGGFIPNSQIPGLDASKIVSGLFAAGMINGLPDFLTNVENVLKSIPGGGLVAGVVGFWADFVNSLLGHGQNAVPAYTFENPVASTLQGQMNAIKAQISTTGEGDSDGFDYPPLSSDWTPIYNSAVVTDGGYVVAGHPGTIGAYYTCQRYNKTAPDTTLYQVNFTLVGTGAPAGALSQGKHRFGLGNVPLSGGRFIVLEVDVNQFGAFIRLGSLTGPLNDFNASSVGWKEYFNVNLANVLKNTDVLAIEVDEVNKLYRPYLNPGPGSSPLYTHVDNLNELSRGTGNRWPFMQLNALNDPFQVGNGWDNFFMFDRI